MANVPAGDWREVRTTMADQLLYLLENEVGSDCAFLVIGAPSCREFQAHKLMLRRASSVFEAMFFGAMKETGKVLITDIQAHIFKHLLRFVYTDKITDDLGVEDLTALCLAADKYLMYNLRETCINQLCTRVDVGNVWSLLQVADLLRKDKLYEAAMMLISVYARSILVSNDIVNVSHAILLAIVQQETLNIKSEMDVINACRGWAIQQCQRQGLVLSGRNIRKVLGDDIISHLRFLTLSPAEFAVGPGVEDWLTSREKNCIFVCLNAPSRKFQLLDGLCNKLKPRPENVDSLGFPIPCNLDTSCFKFPRKGQNISNFHSRCSIIKVQFNTDVWVKSFQVYSQTNDAAIIKQYNTCNAYLLATKSSYVEDMSVSIGTQETDVLGVETLKNLGTFPFKRKVAYNCEINIPCDQVVRLSKDCEYVITILRQVSGYYPFCDDLGSECIRDGEFELLLKTTQYSKRCPLYCITVNA